MTGTRKKKFVRLNAWILFNARPSNPDFNHQVVFMLRTVSIKTKGINEILTPWIEGWFQGRGSNGKRKG